MRVFCPILTNKQSQITKCDIYLFRWWLLFVSTLVPSIMTFQSKHLYWIDIIFGLLLWWWVLTLDRLCSRSLLPNGHLLWRIQIITGSCKYYANSEDHFYLSIIGLETGEPGPDKKQGEAFRENSTTAGYLNKMKLLCWLSSLWEAVVKVELVVTVGLIECTLGMRISFTADLRCPAPGTVLDT